MAARCQKHSHAALGDAVPLPGAVFYPVRSAFDRRFDLLTEKQAAVLGVIKTHIAVKGFPPTLREIGNVLGIGSTNGVHDHLSRLERKGLIHLNDPKDAFKRNRTIVVCAEVGCLVCG